MAVRPYVDPGIFLKNIINTEPVPRTGAVITTMYYGNFTVYTKRITDWTEVTNNLPAIVIDSHAEAIDYYQVDQTTYRLIPISVLVYIPIMTRDIADDEAAVRVAEEQADDEIKTVVGDLEEVLNSTRTWKQVADSVRLIGGGGIFYEAFNWDDALGIKMRIAQINVVVTSQIR